MRCFNQLRPAMFAVSAILLIPGCMTAPGYMSPVGTLPGNGYPVGWGPTTGSVPFVPVNGPGGGYPVTGYIPPGTVPSSPFVPISNPTTPTKPVTPANPDNPSIVVGSPPKPTTPSDPSPPSATPTDPASFWTPWPLPPRNRSAAVSRDRLAGLPRSAHENRSALGRPMRSTVRGGSRAEYLQHESAGMPEHVPNSAERVGSAPSTPSEDLKYRGGRTIQNLSFVNLYVGGNSAWQKSDIESIDRAISAAMADRNLNNVMRQYFNNAEITGTELPSHPLVGYTPSVMTQGDVEYCLSYLYDQGYLAQYDLSSTVFNFLLPPGTVLNDEASRRSTLANATQQDGFRPSDSTYLVASMRDEETDSVIPKAEEGDSMSGLGGYHGSIRKGQKKMPVYYSVDVFSERRPDGSTNGIPVFKEPWKNVVATLYHELQEARTDPDVEDCIRDPYNPNAERYLGWTSDRGEECGDYPISATRQISTVVTEIELTDGSGKAPVQLQYSNAVHGPEGPITEPHPLQQ